MGEKEEKSTAASVHRPGFFHRTSIYGFELFTALFGLATTLIVIDYGIFALFNYLRSMTNANFYVGELTVWVVAAMIVWLPVTIAFYLRSRSEYERNPLHGGATLHKVLVSIYYVLVLFGAIGLAFAAIYALIHLTVTPDESVPDALLRVVAPAVLGAILHVGMMFAYPKSGRPTRKNFVTVFGVIAVLIAALLLIVSAGYIRASKQDETTVIDLGALQASISSYASEHQALPEKIDAVKDLSRDAQTRIDRYTYSVAGKEQYTLCANFMTDTTSRPSNGEVVPMIAKDDGTTSNDAYTSYVNFGIHQKGTVCFKLRAYTNYLPLSSETTTN
jgi:type II secretory pathway pseudopilin PulG